MREERAEGPLGNMHIAVLGAGAMGSFFGGLLLESGQKVTLIDVNDAHLAAIQRDGLRVQSDAGDRRVRGITALRPEQASDVPEVLLLFTKTIHTAAALRGVSCLLAADTHVVSLQNGIGNVEQIAEFVPRERIIIGVTTWPADMVGPGHVHSHGQGTINLMSADGVRHPAVERCAQALNAAGLGCQIDTDVWAAIWEKAAFNAALNSLCAVTGCTVDGLDRLPEGRVLALAIVNEVISVARASGVRAVVDRPAAKVIHALEHHIGHQPSMLQDVLASRRTEIEAINGAVVAAARATGIETPLTETLLTLVRLIDARHGNAPADPRFSRHPT